MFYSKQRDEQDKARAQGKRELPIQVLKRYTPKKEGEGIPVIYVDENDEEEAVLTKRLGTGEPASKQVRFDREGAKVLTNPASATSRLDPSIARRRRRLTPKALANSKMKPAKV